MSNNKKKTASWAIGVLAREFFILDTETTGLIPGTSEIIELAVIDQDGKMVLNQRIKPLCNQIPKEASRIHGTTINHLQNEPTFIEVYPTLKGILEGKIVHIYNAGYDKPMLDGQCEMNGLESVVFSADSDCVMLRYAEFVGDWNHYHQSFRWQQLPGGDHSALGDCLATLDVIKKMASLSNWKMK